MSTTSTDPAATSPATSSRGELVPVPAARGDLLPVQRTESARVALARARLRGVPAPDVVVFTSACPGCGRDAEWHEEREDTRLRVSIACDC